VTTTITSLIRSIQHKHVENIVEEHKDIFSLMRVLLYFHFKHLIVLVHNAPLPNGPIYRGSLIENESISYVHHSYNRSLHNSIVHEPFRV
jgi:hypothetical protein